MKMRMLILSCFFSITLQLSADELPLIGGDGFNFGKEFVNMILNLGLLVAVLVAAAWFMRRLSRSRMHQMNASSGIKIIERRALHPKASIYLLDIMGKKIVISENSSGIRPITEISSELAAEWEALQNLAVTPEKAPFSFKDILSKKLTQPSK